MNKRVAKIMSIVMVLITILSAFSTVIAATNPNTLKGTPTTTFDTFGNKIIGMLQAIGTIVAVVVLVVLGIKYMMGSTEEKAEYKKTMLPYVIGAVLIFAAPYIAGYIYSFASSIN